MAANQSNFVYDQGPLNALERALSVERLSPYLDLAEGDRKYAIHLYEWNTKVSEALYGIVQGFEVCLRNAIHETLTASFKCDTWWDHAPLEAEQKKQVDQARQRIIDDGREVTSGRIVAELMFGFWTALSGTIYAQTLWDHHLHKAFREVPLKRKTVAKRLEED